ncbi:hypothetical protein ACFVXQ_30885 [Kitasatospora sp. NPDC058263]
MSDLLVDSRVVAFHSPAGPTKARRSSRRVTSVRIRTAVPPACFVDVPASSVAP